MLNLVQNLVGKKILVTAGWSHEDIDGVRHYANHARSEGQGFAVAKYLVSLGAEVTIVAAKTRLSTPDRCKMICTDAAGNHIASGQELMNVAHAQAIGGDFDAALCLASISSIKAAEKSLHKIKAKHTSDAPIVLSALGNIDVQQEARSWNVPTIGYDSRQAIFATPHTPDWLRNLIDKIQIFERVESASYDAEPLPTRPTAQFLKGMKVIITSGPTAEKITTTGDVITNFSSGRQGRDMAYAFANYGAEVIYISGPTNLAAPTHAHIHVVGCSSAHSMAQACKSHLPADVFIGVAAVADFGSSNPEDIRLAVGERHDFVLEQNPDILESMGKHVTQRPRVVIGFAAETDETNILDYAAGKLYKKGADMICANLVGASIAKRGSSNNQITFVLPHNKIAKLNVMSKRDVATEIAKVVYTMLSVERSQHVPLGAALSL